MRKLPITGIANSIQYKSLLESTVIGLLQLAIHVVQNRRAGEQKSHWDKTNKENYHFKLCMSFVCLVPVRLLLSSGISLAIPIINIDYVTSCVLPFSEERNI